MVGLAGAVVLLSVLLYRQHRRILRLTESVDRFFVDGIRTELSTEDGALGRLQTDICELEMRLLREREHTKQEGRKNAEFLSDISHQLKTPLAGLRLYCELEQAADSTSHAEKELVLIGKMERLIQNVLRLEKIRSETYRMHFEMCDLGEIATAVRAELQPLFPEKHIQPEGTAQIRADRMWLKEALENLVKNACEHTAPDGMVWIRLHQQEASVSITVEDNGSGVPAEELPKLFDRFRRAANASPNSSGLGLAITKAIIDKHHGVISADNRAEGFAVDICIPTIDANIKL